MSALGTPQCDPARPNRGHCALPAAGKTRRKGVPAEKSPGAPPRAGGKFGTVSAMKFGFFFGLLFPVFILVALVRIVLNDLQVWAGVWSWWTLICTVAGALIGTILETTLKSKPPKKIGEK